MYAEKARRGVIPLAAVKPPYCDKCLTVMPDRPTAEDDDFLQTSWHFYSSCESFAALRLEMFGEAYYKPLEEIEKNKVLEFARRAGLDILPADRPEVLDIDRTNPLQEGEE